jgi:protein SCO1
MHPDNCSPKRRSLVVALAAAATGLARAAADPTQPLAPRMDFTPPAAGSYQLQRIQTCPDGVVLDAAARRVSLRELSTGKITLLSFFYTYCTDAWGCPFAYTTLIALRQRLLADPALARGVRFVNISFDPIHDSPETLRLYAGRLHADPRLEWRFATARSLPELLPLLEGFGQDVAVVNDAQGRPTRTRNHMLKMFLIDRQGMVREIYSLDFLQPPVLYNDIRTLALEAGVG